jgi:hypothetical protein
MNSVQDPGLILAGIDAAALIGISVYFSNEISSIKDEIKNTDINSINDKIVTLGSFVKDQVKPQNYSEIKRQLQESKNNINILNEKINKIEQITNMIFISLKNTGVIKIENNDNNNHINNENKEEKNDEKIDDINDFLSEI